MHQQSFCLARIVAFLFFCGTAVVGYAQTNSYLFTQSVQSFSQTSRGIVPATASNAGLRSLLDPSIPAGSTTATTRPGFPIGFNFIYRGVAYDRFGVMNSGWICLGRSQYGDQTVDIGQLQYQPLEKIGPANDTLRARIVGFDANLIGNGTSSSLAYDVTGDSTDMTLLPLELTYVSLSNSPPSFKQGHPKSTVRDPRGVRTAKQSAVWAALGCPGARPRCPRCQSGRGSSRPTRHSRGPSPRRPRAPRSARRHPSTRASSRRPRPSRRTRST